MNVAINASILDSKPTGLGIYTINIINELARLAKSKKYDFTIYSANSTLFSLNANFQVKKIPKYVQPSEYYRFASIFRFLWNQLIYPIRAKDFDLSYSPTTHGSSLLKNQIITIHDLLALSFPQQNKFQYYYYKYFLPKIIKNSKAVITVSQSTKKDVMKYLNYPQEKIHVIYNGYNKNIFSPKSKANNYIKDRYNIKEYILTIGATYPHKNIERLIISYSQLPRYMKNKYHLIIVGWRETYIRKLKFLIKEKRLEKNIVLLEYVFFKDLPHLYSEAKVMVYPSLYEGFGLPALEAMACECPVIVSNSSSLTEVCGDAALYIDPYDCDSIGAGIMKVLTNTGLREDLKEKGLERVKMFSWEKTAEKILNVFDIIA